MEKCKNTQFVTFKRRSHRKHETQSSGIKKRLDVNIFIFFYFFGLKCFESQFFNSWIQTGVHGIMRCQGRDFDSQGKQEVCILNAL